MNDVDLDDGETEALRLLRITAQSGRRRTSWHVVKIDCYPLGSFDAIDAIENAFTEGRFDEWPATITFEAEECSVSLAESKSARSLTEDDYAPVLEDDDDESGPWRRELSVADRPAARKKIFWVTTEDHDEDWFVIATTAMGAAAYFAGYEGYNESDAHAEFVALLPEGHEASDGYAEKEDLVAAGAEFLPEVQEVPEVKGASELLGCGSRVVKINGRVYCEGNLARNVFSHNSANIKNGAS